MGGVHACGRIVGTGAGGGAEEGHDRGRRMAAGTVGAVGAVSGAFGLREWLVGVLVGRWVSKECGLRAGKAKKSARNWLSMLAQSVCGLLRRGRGSPGFMEENGSLE